MLATTTRCLLLLTAAPLATGQATLYRVDGPAPQSGFGNPLDGVGDIDGDGVPDWAAGGHFGLSLHSGADGAVLRTFPKPAGVNSIFGRVLCVPGDLDGDGASDLVLADPLDTTGGASAGAVHVYSSSTGALLRTQLGQPGERVGDYLEALGDLNGDGVGDFAVSVNPQFMLQTRLIDGATGAQLAQLPGSVFGIEDVDGDGVPDLYRTEFDIPAIHELLSGATLLPLTQLVPTPYNWTTTVAALGDVDGDGAGDLALGLPNYSGSLCAVQVYSGATGTLLREHRPLEAASYYGTFIDSGGDVNGDGICDLLVGAPGIQGSDRGNPFSPPSSAYVYSGADGQLLTTYRGAFEFNLFGGDLAILGDIDGDGLDDVGVGAPLSSNPQVNAGAVTVFRGSDCLQLRNYCTSTPTSHFQQAAWLEAAGSMQLGDQELTLYAGSSPAGELGVFFAASQPAFVMSGDGFLCVGGALTRLGTVQIGVTGLAALDLAPNLSAFAPGQTVYFQFAFRDPGGPGGTGFNYSDGLAGTFCP